MIAMYNLGVQLKIIAAELDPPRSKSSVDQRLKWLSRRGHVDRKRHDYQGRVETRIRISRSCHAVVQRRAKLAGLTIVEYVSRLIERTQL